MSRKLIPVAIAYDFDGTLAPGNMQEYDFLPALNIKSKAFWKEVKQLALDQEADEILAYMRLMLSKAQTAQLPVKKADFKNFGASILLFPGVQDWFDRINAYGKAHGCKVEHFIISSGIREMIEGTKIFKKFRKVYGSGFMFDHNGIANWPAVAMNYTTKTQYLFRINKGSLDVHDNSVINKFVPKEDRPVPFENMLFIGDGETDIPCMRLVKDQGGHAIAVYNPGKHGAKDTAAKLVNDGRATLYAPASYEPGSQVEQSVQAIIDRIEATSRIGLAGSSMRRRSQQPEPVIDPLKGLSE
jgi:phosphoserine phosphatase